MANEQQETVDKTTGEITSGQEAEDMGGVPATAEVGMVTQLARVEIDTAISTARAYPRSIDVSRKEIMAMIPNEEAAEELIYALPRGGKKIRGPSIRFAEIVVAAYGNCESGARVTHIGDEFVEAEGVFRDYQKNVRKVRRVRRRILDKNGRRYNDDMILITCNAACSIAERNSILAGVPKAVWGDGYTQVFAMIGGAIGTIEEKRKRALAALADLGVSSEKVFALLEVKGEADIVPDDIITLRGVVSALRSGEETVASLFNARTMSGKQFDTVKSPLKDDANNGGADVAGKSGEVQTQSGQGQTAPANADQTAKVTTATAQTAAANPDQTGTAREIKLPTKEEYIASAKTWISAAKSISQIDDWWRRERSGRVAQKFTTDEINALEDFKDARKEELTKK